MLLLLLLLFLVARCLGQSCVFFEHAVYRLTSIPLCDVRVHKLAYLSLVAQLVSYTTIDCVDLVVFEHVEEALAANDHLSVL